MLSTIARSYNMGWKTLMEVNGLSNEMIRPGQSLFIPDTVQGGAAAAEIASVSFQKPAQGKLIGSFGQPSTDPADQGNLDGVLIQGLAGAAVTAAANGDVVDAGYEQKGRGRFVIVSHESDALPGLSTRLNSKWARYVCIAFPEASGGLPEEKVVVTGNPIRPQLFSPVAYDLKQKLGISGKLVFVIGGSLGSHQINQLVWDNLDELTKSAFIYHQSGKADWRHIDHGR